MAELWKSAPLPDGSYQDASRPFSDQDVVNYWTEYPSGQGTRSQHKLVQLPGLRPYLDLGAGPHRGIRNVEGTLFLVADTHAYRVTTDGDVTQLGTIPGRGRVWISHNQNDSGAVRQVMFSTGPEGWIYDVASEAFTQISDDAFRGARSLVYLNSRFLGIENQRRHFANSFLSDGLNWDNTETYQAESSPDRLVALVAYAGEILAFNGGTLEFFQNTTNQADIDNHIYFTRVGPPVQVGAASAHAVVVIDNRVFFLSSRGRLEYMSGYTPIRVSTHAIEAEWESCDLSKAFIFTYESRGHAVVYLTFPDGRTWGYDCATEKFHRRQTIGLDRWRLNTLVAWNGDYYGGAYNSGILYKVDWTYEGLEGCDEIVREYTTGVLHDEGNRVTLNGLRIECDTGYGTSTCVEPEEVTFDQISVVVQQGGWGFQLHEFSPGDLTFELIGEVQANDIYYASRPFMLGNDLVVVRASNLTEAAIRFHRPASDMELIDQILNDADRYCIAAEKLSETRFLAVYEVDADSSMEVDLVEWDGVAPTVIDTQAVVADHGVPDYLQSCVCQGKGIFLCSGNGDDKFLICSVSGDTLTCTFSTVGPSNSGGNGLAAVGNTITTSKGLMFTFDGSDMTLVQATVDTNSEFATTDGNGVRFFLGDTGMVTGVRLVASPYTKTTIATDWNSAPGGGGGYIFIAADVSAGAQASDVLQWDSAAYASLCDFETTINEGDYGNMVTTVVKVPT